MNPAQLITWIPVGEELPAIGEEVMLAMRHGKLWTAKRQPDGFWRDGAIISIRPECVTHWAEPLKHPDELSSKNLEEPA